MDTCKKTYTYKDYCIMNLGDCYTIMYGYISKHLIDDFGEKGERAVRRGTRHYGWDRGFVTRNKCLAANAKINMENLFSMFGDLPGDPRFRREKQRLNPQERVSHTLVCPMADIWIQSGQRREGRIYCEEFHPACYSHYAYDFGQVNLSKTLTQEGDTYCAFNVKLIAQDVPQEYKKLCFAEFDPDYEKPQIGRIIPDAKTGFNSLSIKLYYHILDCVMNDLGEAGAASMEAGLTEFAKHAAKLLKETAQIQNVEADAKYVEDNFPMNLQADQEPMWNQPVTLTKDPSISAEEGILPDSTYGKHSAKERIERSLISVLRKELELSGI